MVATASPASSYAWNSPLTNRAALERNGDLLLEREALEAAQPLQSILRPCDRFAELAVTHKCPLAPAGASMSATAYVR